uniref:AlNc14C300G10366 protein n=1 Tax=Albugo laibachii Nc14 TaxID=890382 RepID=F0WVM9_9STRA|nr:AlNc14C300G10366 [Albugo laibachii Nc14]|eukprot:CCA25473.1 AlNc14C300G10366 [Albugo laibachii Nc14]
MVPKAFCFEHLAFVSTAPNHSIDRKKIHKFTEESIPVGFWPPQVHRIVSIMDTKSSSPSFFSHSESEVGTQIWPVHDNIAVVRFEYATDQQIDCIKCLMEHSEVFLLYTAERTPDGYVWMRQAPAKILKLCVGNLCSSLAYDEQRMQIQRHAGLLQLTTGDNPFIQKGKQ